MPLPLIFRYQNQCSFEANKFLNYWAINFQNKNLQLDETIQDLCYISMQKMWIKIGLSQIDRL